MPIAARRRSKRDTRRCEGILPETAYHSFPSASHSYWRPAPPPHIPFVSLQAIADVRSQLERTAAREIESLTSQHEWQLGKAREEARSEALREAARANEEAMAQAVARVREALEKEKREALLGMARESEQALKQVMIAAAEQQAQAVAEARQQLEEELLSGP